MHRVLVVGIGEDGLEGLTPTARRVVESAQLLIGTERLLAMVPAGGRERRVMNPGAEAALDLIESSLADRSVVVLASGDPGFFGIGRVLVRRLGKERVEIIPHQSSVQLAFARIKESWEDATFLSVHGRSLDGIARAVQGSRKVAILTDGKNTPAAIARELLARGVTDYRAYLCEALGSASERVREAALPELIDFDSSPLNVLVLIRRDTGDARALDARWRHGIPDEEFLQRRPRRGLITKLEVRMAALGLLDLREDGVFWDIGSGSGSVAIEAALLMGSGRAYAIERDPEGIDLIRQNVERFGPANVIVVQGEAPEAVQGLPDPDSVFVGGSGGRLIEILEAATRRLLSGGRIVVTAASIETVNESASALRRLGLPVEVTQMQVSRGKNLAGLTHLEALNPVFLVAGRK